MDALLRKYFPPKGKITYHRGTSGKEPFLILRGAATKDPAVKSLMRSYGLVWVEKAGMRRIMGWRAYLPLNRQAELLRKLIELNCEVVPTSKAGAKALPLDPKASIFKIKSLVQGQTEDQTALIAWFEANGYSRLVEPEKTGDFSIKGGTVTIFSYGTPSRKVRLDFDGDTIETIRQYRDETKAWHNLLSVRLYGKGAA